MRYENEISTLLTTFIHFQLNMIESRCLHTKYERSFLSNQ